MSKDNIALTNACSLIITPAGIIVVTESCRCLSVLVNPILHHTPVIHRRVALKQFGPHAVLPRRLHPDIAEQHIPIRQLIENQVRIKPTVPVRRPVLRPSLEQRRLFKDAARAAVDVKVGDPVFKVRQHPEALHLEAHDVGEVAEGAEEDEGAVIACGEAWRGDTAVEAPGGVGDLC